MEDVNKVIDIIKSHYPNSSVKIEDFQLLSNDIIMLTGDGGKKVIYRLDGDDLFIYKGKLIGVSQIYSPIPSSALKNRFLPLIFTTKYFILFNVFKFFF